MEVAPRELLVDDEPLELAADRGAVGKPQWQAWPDSIVDREKLEVPAFVILSTSQLSEIAAQKTGFRAIPHAVLSKDPLIRIFEVQQK